AFRMGALLLGLAPVVARGLRESKGWEVSRKNPTAQASSLRSPEYRANLLRGSLVFGTVLVGLWAVFSWTPSWVQTLFATEAEARPVRGLTMILFGLGGITGGALSGFLVKKLGLRRTLLGTFAGCLLGCWLLFGTNTQFSPLIYVETALLSLCFGVSQGALSTFVPLLFPTAIRATATGFCFNIGRILTATGVFFVGSLVAVFGGLGNALLLFSLMFIVSFAVMWFEPKQSKV
ncbi:MAG: MFS transporter, partial [Sphingobacteriaceae bacterium]|nr:MFS transporter [Cytophagaceae bacterium]